ncbi:hypothetical protein F2P81_018265 [Scophthalmus maximus]|uniref:DUF7886 domain-containing protein n=1 Tax=Scophthalmus maximus TaxID=52904 RepID=A0A6A4SBQ9_SCOMX|nr:hypothetical protein F2P81_018265 [Scophthalmus maximus]
MRIWDPSSEDHLLPASPSEREIAVPEVNCTLFLLAGYVKYGRPYAWIRSNHERLVNIGGTDSMVRDTPMKLKSIADWQTRGVRVWDIVSELVCLCTVPSPSNPFALDTRYIRGLPLPERFLATGALLNFLEMYVVYGNQDELHYDKVVEEVKPLRRLHVQSLLEVQRRREAPRPSCGPTVQDSSGEDGPFFAPRILWPTVGTVVGLTVSFQRTEPPSFAAPASSGRLGKQTSSAQNRLLRFAVDRVTKRKPAAAAAAAIACRNRTSHSQKSTGDFAASQNLFRVHTLK